MATRIIKAWIDGTVQEIEVEDIVSPAQPLSVEERVDKLEDKHEVVFTDGNLLVGNGTDELEEMTPEEVLSHINGASVRTMTTAEYEALEESETNANTLYMLTDSEEENIIYVAQDVAPDDTDVLWVDTSDDTSDFEQISLDTSLSISGKAADAKAVGDALEEKQPRGNYLTKVPTASEVGADSSGTASSLIEAHNIATDAHEDIREQIIQVSNEISDFKKIYIGNTAPTDISDGAIWIDTSEE